MTLWQFWWDTLFWVLSTTYDFFLFAFYFRIWNTLTDNYGNVMAVDWKTSHTRALHLPTLNLLEKAVSTLWLISMSCLHLSYSCKLGAISGFYWETYLLILTVDLGIFIYHYNCMFCLLFFLLFNSTVEEKGKTKGNPDLFLDSF